MDKVFNHGGMIAASLVALTVGYGVFQTATVGPVEVPVADQAEVETAVLLKEEQKQVAAQVQTDPVQPPILEEYEQGVQDLEIIHRSADTRLMQPSGLDAAPMIAQKTHEVDYYLPEPVSRNKFTNVENNTVKQTIKEPISTFSIDTDTASYSFVRRQLMSGRAQAPDSVRVEEMINYFDYNYPVSESVSTPFSVSTQVIPSPWNAHNKLIHIGIKAFEPKNELKPKSNLVFLVDTSGSMQSQDKLPLLVNSMRLLVNNLNDNDRVSIVTYAGSAGTLLEPTSLKNQEKVVAALEQLTAGGSTAGHAGIRQAYALAERNFDKNAVNRIILATDGDFNVGIDDPEKLKDYIAQKRKTGVFLSILGFGDGNYNDHLMQTLAQNGNGQAFYIDTLNEAQKVLVDASSSTLFPVAKDVKIQIEFNPKTVAEYRLIGYETRQLNQEDFNNDQVDAGEIGAGHAVTAIYEITPSASATKLFDASRYQTNQVQTDETFGNEYAFLKLRYKQPDSQVSQKLTFPITVAQQVSQFDQADQDVRFAVAVAGFGQLLKNSVYVNAFTFDDVLKIAQSSKGNDPFGYRSEFIRLVNLAKASQQN